MKIYSVPAATLLYSLTRIAKRIATSWHDEPLPIKRYYQHIALLERMRLNILHPNYTPSPRKPKEIKRRPAATKAFKARAEAAKAANRAGKVARIGNGKVAKAAKAAKSPRI